MCHVDSVIATRNTALNAKLTPLHKSLRGPELEAQFVLIELWVCHERAIRRDDGEQRLTLIHILKVDKEVSVFVEVPSSAGLGRKDVEQPIEHSRCIIET